MDSTEGVSDQFKFFGLGGCNEVGRSCHIIEYKNKVIMLDSGVHPGITGFNSLPFYDEYDLSKVDVLLISHFHLDHAASLPYVMRHTNFNGRVFMTHPTKAIYRWLLSDFIKITTINGSGDMRLNNDDGGGSGNIYTDDDLSRSFDRIETVDYHSTIELDGIRFTAYHAGHVLGACMYLIEIGGLKVLFTGDFSTEEDRHLQVAEVPPVKPDIMISESTFGTATHEPRLEKERRMMNIIHSTLLKGGRVLMPVFALGRAQELLLVLEEYWSMNEDLQNINIYFASSLARKCMAVYQTYTNIMNDSIRLMASSTSSSHKKNPFEFNYIKYIRNLDKFQDFGPCVVVASPGMLQNGVSRELLEKWAPDPKNAVLMTGYSVEGTMAKDLLAEPPTIQSANNADITIPRRLSIDEISFAAHVDFQQNSKFIAEVNPLSIILVHGESIPMGRLKSALLSKYATRKGTDQEVRVYNPRNCDELKLNIKGLKIAKVLGSLAEEQLMLLKKKVSEKIDEDKVEQEDDNAADEDNKEEKTDDAIDKESNDKGKTEEESKDTIRTDQALSGMLVSKDFDLNLLQIENLPEYTLLTTSIINSRINLKINAEILLMLWHLEQMFGYVDIVNDDEQKWACVIMDMIMLTVDKNSSKTGCYYVNVEWINDNLMADSLADSVIAILYSIDSSPASVKLSTGNSSRTHDGIKKEEPSLEEVSQPKNIAHANTDVSSRIHRITTLLEAQFGETFRSLPDSNNTKAIITIGKNEAQIDFLTLKVECKSKVLRDRIDTIIRRGCSLAAPLSQRDDFSIDLNIPK